MKFTQIQEKWQNVTIYPLCKIPQPENVTIGEFTQIDDFTFINASKVTIGRYVHISLFVSILGPGEIIIDDYVGIAAGARIITGTDHYHNKDGIPKRLNALVPKSHRSDYIAGVVQLKKDSFIGTNSVIMPDVVLGEGTIVGACSFVPRGLKLKEWTIYAGNPIKQIKKRPKHSLPNP